MQENIEASLDIKATLLADGFIKISQETFDNAKRTSRKLVNIIADFRNLYSWPWLFFRINGKTRVRMIVDPTEKCDFELLISESEDDSYQIIDRGKNIIAHVMLEDSLYHCPEQVFYNLYTWCSNDCAYCPLAGSKPRSRDTARIMVKVANNIDKNKLKAIGITTGIPSHIPHEKIVEEMAKGVEALRKVLGPNIPVGVSPYACSRDGIIRLRSAGADEIRINSETFNPLLHGVICPQKDLDQILFSLETAVDVFGRNRVSSNIVLGLGESDEDIEKGIIELCNRKVIPTIYPLDLIPSKMEVLLERSNGKASRPQKDRLLHIAHLHKEALLSANLDPTQLKTMCPSCTASHIMPGFDL